jgi:hypothetical protein
MPYVDAICQSDGPTPPSNYAPDLSTIGALHKTAFHETRRAIIRTGVGPFFGTSLLSEQHGHDSMGWKTALSSALLDLLYPIMNSS